MGFAGFWLKKAQLFRIVNFCLTNQCFILN